MGHMPTLVQDASVPSPQPEESGIDLRQLWGAIVRGKLIIAVTVLLAVAVAGGVCVLVEPKFTAQALVAMDVHRVEVVDLPSVMSAAKPDPSVLGTELDIITSSATVGRVVDELGLASDPEFNDRLRPASKSIWGTVWEPIRDSIWEVADLPALRPVTAWLKEEWASLGLSAPRRPPAPDSIRDRVIDEVTSRLTIRNGHESYTIRIAVASKDPAKAALIANTVADVYVREQLRAKTEATDQAATWLAGRLQALHAQVRKSEEALKAYQEQQGLYETGGSSLVVRKLAELNSQLVLAQAATSNADAKLATAKAMSQSGRVESSAEALSSPVIQRLRELETDLKRREADLLSRFGPAHPMVVNIREEGKELRRRIQEEAARVMDGIAGELDAARKREAILQQAIARLEREAAERAQAEVQFNQLRREAEASQRIYENFLTRSKQVGEQSDLNRPDARIIALAAVPSSPSFPKPKLLLAAAAGLGTALGMLLALLAERLHNGFRTAQHVERVVGRPVVSLIPKLPRPRRGVPESYALTRPLSAYSEALRRIWTSLGPDLENRSLKSLLVTSAVPKEGKTTLCIALARRIAASGQRVLLIDADLHRPRVAQTLDGRAGGRVEAGLYDVLTGDCDLPDAIAVDETSGLHYLPAGRGPVRDIPCGLLASERMRKVIDAALRDHDVVLIDSPPVMAVHDAVELSKLTDGCLFLVRWSSTPREVAVNAIEQLCRHGVAIVGVALTQVDVRKHAKYSSGAYSHYGRRYAQYFDR